MDWRPSEKSSLDNHQVLKPSSQWVLFVVVVVKSLQSCPTLCDPIDGRPPGYPVPGILQARTLEWVAISFSNAWKWKVKVKSLSRVWLSRDPMDCSLPGFSIHGIFQARVLESGALKRIKLVSTFILPGFPGSSVVKNLPASAGDANLVPGLERSSGKGNNNPLQ